MQGLNAQAQPAQSPLVHSYSRLDFIRAGLAEIIAQWHAAPLSDRPGVLMRLRIAQDQIATLRHNHPRMAATPSRYASVVAGALRNSRR